MAGLIVAAAAVAGVAVLFVEWLAAIADTVVHRVSACSAAERCSAPGWDVSAAPSGAGYPSAAAGAVAPNVACSAVTGLPNLCYPRDWSAGLLAVRR